MVLTHLTQNLQGICRIHPYYILHEFVPLHMFSVYVFSAWPIPWAAATSYSESGEVLHHVVQFPQGLHRAFLVPYLLIFQNNLVFNAGSGSCCKSVVVGSAAAVPQLLSIPSYAAFSWLCHSEGHCSMSLWMRTSIQSWSEISQGFHRPLVFSLFTLQFSLIDQISKYMPSGFLTQQQTDWFKLHRHVPVFLTVYNYVCCSLDL